MKRRSHAKQRDLNEPAIVEALRRAGCRVYLLDEPFDLLVGHRGRTWLVEVKRGEKPPADRPLKPSQIAFLASWNGGPAIVVRCVEEALCALGIARHPGKMHDGACDCGGVDDPIWFSDARAADVAARREAKKATK